MQHPQILSVKMYEIDKPVYLLSFKEVLHSLVFCFLFFFFFCFKMFPPQILCSITGIPTLRVRSSAVPLTEGSFGGLPAGGGRVRE